METEAKVNLIMKLMGKYLTFKYGEEKIQKFIDSPVFKQYFISPASYRRDYICCYPGGLSDLSIQTFKNMWWLLNVNKSNGRNLKDKFKIDEESIVLVSLFYNLGKVGSYDSIKNIVIPYFFDWSQYECKVNNDLVKIPVHLRSINLLSIYGIIPDETECQAIMSVGERNATMADYDEEPLSTYLKMANRMAIDLLRVNQKRGVDKT